MDSLTGPNNAIAGFAKAHDMAKNMFDQTGTGVKNGQTVAAALQGLSKLGDMVTSEDVIKAAGSLVASGVHGASEMAQMLADLPQGGEGISGWVNAKLQQNQANMQKIQQLHALTRHETAVSGLRLLAAQHGGASQMAEASPGAAPQANELAPTGPGMVN